MPRYKNQSLTGIGLYPKARCVKYLDKISGYYLTIGECLKCRESGHKVSLRNKFKWFHKV